MTIRSSRPREGACPDCDLIYSNANQDASQQQSQMEAALTIGADVVVLDPVDATSAASMVQLAKQQNVPVVSYDRLILDSPTSTRMSRSTTSRSASCRATPWPTS